MEETRSYCHICEFRIGSLDRGVLVVPGTTPTIQANPIHVPVDSVAFQRAAPA